MKIILIVALIFILPGNIYGKEKNDFIVKLKHLSVDTNAKGSLLGGSAYVSNDSGLLEIDFSYFLSNNISLELILASSKHNVSIKNSSSGHLDLGTVKLLPPTLLLQYHFLRYNNISPYIGAGVNYTFFYDKKIGSSINQINYSNEFGLAFQLGFDIVKSKNINLNFDIKKIFLETNIHANNSSLQANNTKIDPWLFSIGFGYVF